MPIPADEAERLLEMEELGVLDPALEPKLHSIAVLAARICRVPVALVNLVGGERQYFQGRVGTDLSGVDRDSGFCPYVVEAGAPMEIHDALADPRVREDALVTGEPHVRYYAGAPLLSSRGHALGTVCLFDHRPRQLTSEQREVLLSLAANATMLLELHGRDLEESGQVAQGLQELRELKEQFLRTVNHELRTPMTSIRSYLQLLEEGGLDEATELRFLEVVERNRAHLLDLLDDLLLLASLNAGSLGFSPDRADLAGVTRQAITDVIDEARSKGHTLNLHAPAGAEVWVDAERLREALRHLLDNAVKFTRPGGTIDVTVTAEPTPTLEIRDTGIAVGAEALKYVFEDFYRAPNAEEQAIAGLGVGLSITDKIVRWHGGEVKVENQASGGIRIVLTLPRTAPAQRSGPP
ncbi:GAF domain-containing sensor histidine kinase [Planomonospora sp. ID67723]|uniref:GAF domain-containing sensor histidine kinase n=1 Tax=Planomonospora sp. ID67723 TaxID=2738134 RepID=UPI001E422C0B|nr:GAF domain-containing sensor histidine kinase [Planomonospora sp. ID67723]